MRSRQRRGTINRKDPAHLTKQALVPAPSVLLCAVRWLWRSDFPVAPRPLVLRNTGLLLGVTALTAASRMWRG